MIESDYVVEKTESYMSKNLNSKFLIFRWSKDGEKSFLTSL